MKSGAIWWHDGTIKNQGGCVSGCNSLTPCTPALTHNIPFISRELPCKYSRMQAQVPISRRNTCQHAFQANTGTQSFSTAHGQQHEQRHNTLHKKLPTSLFKRVRRRATESGETRSCLLTRRTLRRHTSTLTNRLPVIACAYMYIF